MNGAKIRRESRAFYMISKKLKASEWGSNVVRQLSEYIRTQDPTIKGWSYRTIYKMVQFYETYSSESFKELMQSTKLAQFTKMELPSAATGFVPFEMVQIMPKEFVPTELAQIPSVLFFTGWSNHQLILNRSTKKNASLMRIRQSASSCAKNQTWKLFVLPSIAA